MSNNVGHEIKQKKKIVKTLNIKNILKMMNIFLFYLVNFPGCVSSSFPRLFFG